MTNTTEIYRKKVAQPVRLQKPLSGILDPLDVAQQPSQNAQDDQSGNQARASDPGQPRRIHRSIPNFFSKG